MKTSAVRLYLGFWFAYLLWIMALSSYLSTPFYVARLLAPVIASILFFSWRKHRQNKDFSTTQILCNAFSLILLSDWLFSIKMVWQCYWPNPNLLVVEYYIYYLIFLGALLGAIFQPLGRLGLMEIQGKKRFLKPRTVDAMIGPFWTILIVLSLCITINDLVPRNTQTQKVHIVEIQSQTWRNWFWDTSYLVLLKPWQTEEWSGAIILWKDGIAHQCFKTASQLKQAQDFMDKGVIKITIHEGILGWKRGIIHEYE